jgi:hypothetical protein
MKSLTKILLLTTLVVLPLLAPAPAHAARKMEVAIQDDGVFLYNQDIGREAALRAARALGATHLRLNVLWGAQAVVPSQQNQTSVPSNITYNFAPWDFVIQRAAAYGIKTQLDLTGDPPAWACGTKRPPYQCDGNKPKIKYWKHFVAAAADHFRGSVKRYSLWNEPNWHTWLSPHKKSPRLYRKLVQTGYKAIKRQNKKAEVVIGELAPHYRPKLSIPPLQFIREMVCVNKRLKPIKGAKKKCKGKLKFDAFAHHPYELERKPSFKRPNKDEVTVANLPALTKLLTKLRKKGLIKPKRKKFPIYLTEYGYMVENPQVRPSRQIPEPRRAKWIVNGWKIAQKTPRIKQNLHYDLVSPKPGAPEGYFDMGLLTSSGDPRTSYFKLGNWIQEAAADGKVAKPGPCSAC